LCLTRLVFGLIGRRFPDRRSKGNPRQALAFEVYSPQARKPRLAAQKAGSDRPRLLGIDPVPPPGSGSDNDYSARSSLPDQAEHFALTESYCAVNQ